MTKPNSVSPCCDDTNFQYEPLLETESSLMFFLAEPAIASVTFFRDVDFEKSLNTMKKRISLICHANPWLAGRLVKNKKIHKNLLLAVPNRIDENDIDALLCSEDVSLSNISTQMQYEKMCKALYKSNALVPEGYKLIGTENKVAKFVLVPVAKGEVALLLSITHAVADGYTYYKILSMLTEGSTIESLSICRKHEFIPKMKTAIGEHETKMLLSPGLMLNMIPKMIFGPKAQFNARFVDKEKIQHAKLESESRLGKSIHQTFACSTNDILTSTFGNATKANLLLMAINLRNRLQEANNMDAGNYESVLTYDPPSYAKPEIIRQSLHQGAPFKRVGGLPLPGFFKLLRARFAMITNWAFPTFKADLELVGTSSSESLKRGIHLHLPIYHPSAVIFPIAIIFRPSFGKLAILYAGSPRDLSQEQLIADGTPLGDSVNDMMFS